VRRVLLIGSGEAGAKHLDALACADGLTVAGVVDPCPASTLPEGAASFTCWRPALRALRPDLVIVATPPGIALAAARDAAAAAEVVLVEKPVTTDAAALAPRPGDGRIFVAFQPHFAPGLPELIAEPPGFTHAEVILDVRRDPGYFRGWRRSFATAGGVLHQQAIHGLALTLRLLPGELRHVEAIAVHRRGLADTEDRITANITFDCGTRLRIDARVDHDGPPRHELLLHQAGGSVLHVRGRNLEAGLGDPDTAPTHTHLRHQLYAAVLATADGEPLHPSLFPLPALQRPLEVIDRVYRSARIVRNAHAATA
jgi:predicted dehydrogenase